MPRLPACKPRAVIRVLERAGFSLVRTRGSHRYYRNLNRPGSTLTHVAYHNRDIPDGTLRSILSQANLSREEFLELL